jgi:hypothetical protein
MKAVHIQPSGKQCFSSILTNVCEQTYMMNYAWPPINVVCGVSKRKFQRQILWYVHLYGKGLCTFFYSTFSLSGTPTSKLQLDLLYKYVYCSWLEKKKNIFFFLLGFHNLYFIFLCLSETPEKVSFCYRKQMSIGSEYNRF